MKLKTIFESVYNEFGKLDSLEEKLSPKLKALLAAGLIGTASLGMQSCAQPTGDDPYYGDGTNTEVTAPAPTDNITTDTTTNETPAPTRETPKEEDGEEKPVEENWEETVCGQLGISKADADLLKGREFTSMDSNSWIEDTPGKHYIYKNGTGFEEVTNGNLTGDYYITLFKTNGTTVTYGIPFNTDAGTSINALGKQLGLTLKI